MFRYNVSYRTALICCASFLTGIGLLAIYASSSVYSSQLHGNEFAYVQKQAIVAFCGFFLIFLFGHLPFKWIERATLPLLVLTVVLLASVQLPGIGHSAKGAARWLVIGGFSVQPGELAKLAMVLFLAKNLARTRSNMESFASGILPNLIVTSLLGILLMLQPDFGTTVMLAGICFLMMCTAGLPRRYLALSIAGLLLLAAGAVAVAPYRMARLLSFLDPWAEIRGSGFQIIQSYLGFQNGGFLGAGLGESRQKLYFLPEAHTDFILAVIGEELGLIGVLLMCALFAYLLYLGFRITQQQKLVYRRFLAFGLTLMIASQALVNMGVTMGLLPTKGMTLPFVSNGANSLIVFLLAIAILARISQEVPGEYKTRP